ncbi:RNA polymerase sigma factor [Dyadobacter luticola]|nr:sigma-70 family RNA polymerase sigma factor [Dyadobacter luticola]
MEKQFVAVLNQNRAALFKICKIYCADPEDRRDLFQEIVIQLWQAFPTFRGESGASTWVYRIGMNTAISNFRKTTNRRSTSPFSSFDMEIPELQDTAENPIDTGPLYQAIDQLNVIEKALVLLYLEDKSYDEMSAILGISKSNVGVKLNRVKTKLEKLIKTQTL